MKFIITLLGATGLEFENPTGIYEASCSVSIELSSLTIALPKTAPKLKNTAPRWNKQAEFTVEGFGGTYLNITLIETSDTCVQRTMGNASIPLTYFESLEENEIVDVSVGSARVELAYSTDRAEEEEEEDYKFAIQTIGPFRGPSSYTPKQKVQKYLHTDIKRKHPHIAKGTYGVVFKGSVTGISQEVVIKDMEILDQLSVDDWQKEIQIMAKTKSPYIAEVFGYSNNVDQLTIIMEYMDLGGSSFLSSVDLFGILHKRADQHPLSLIMRMRMSRHCCLGLKVLHDFKIIHRDIKSMNILVSAGYVCKLTDFGCSKLVTGTEKHLQTANAGTPLWMAPEVKTGNYSFPSDIYSMGLVLYEIFEKKLPDYDPDTQKTTVPKKFDSDLVVLPCLKRRPDTRPNVQTLISLLERLINRIVTSIKANLSDEKYDQICGDYESEADQNEALYNFLINLPPAEADNYVSGRGEPEAEQSSTPPEPSQADAQARADEERKKEEERKKREQFEREKQQRLDEKAAKERAEKERLQREKEERDRKLREEQERLAREREAQRERERKAEEERRRREAEDRERLAREKEEAEKRERLRLEQQQKAQAPTEATKLQHQEERERKRSSENLLLKRTYSRGLVRTMSEGSRLVADTDSDPNATPDKAGSGASSPATGSPGGREGVMMGGQRSRPFLNPRPQSPSGQRPSSLNQRDTFLALGNRTAEAASDGEAGSLTYTPNTNNAPVNNNPRSPNAQIARPSSSHGFVSREQTKNALSNSADAAKKEAGAGTGTPPTDDQTSNTPNDKLAQAKSVPELNVALLRNSHSGASSFRKSAKPTNSQVMAEALKNERANEQSPQRGSGYSGTVGSNAGSSGTLRKETRIAIGSKNMPWGPGGLGRSRTQTAFKRSNSDAGADEEKGKMF